MAQRLDEGRHASSATGWRRWPGTPGGIWNAWYGILGIGAIYHTVNPRLFPDQIVWIINHAEDRVMLIDLTFVPLLEKIADRLPTIERYVVLTDAAHMPATSLKNAVAYEDWIGEVDGDFAWKSFDENTAAGMCYTSGTTGNPKGVVYSHRTNVLHSMMASLPDAKAGVVARRRACRWCRCSTPIAGAWRFDRADERRDAGDAGRQDGRRLDLRIAQRLSRHLHRRGADRVADAAATSANRPAPSCLISSAW